MKSLPRGVVLGVVGLLAIVRGAAATPTDDDAKLHYQSGASHYEAGRYAAAVMEFEIAYEASKRPAILFNLARAETKLGHDEKAIEYLKRYLEAAPDAADAPAVRAEIEAREKALGDLKARLRAEVEMEEARKREAAARERSVSAEAEAERSAKQAQQSDAKARVASYPRWPGYLLLGGGGALVVVGISLGALAAADSAKVSSSANLEWNECCAAAETRGRIAGPAGLAFDVLGGALVATGVGLTVWALRGRATVEKRVWLAPVGTGLRVGGSF